MNAGQHIIIGVGTAGVGLLAAQAIGLPQPDIGTMLLGAGIVAAGSLAVDIDHPKAFVSRSLPHEILKRALPILSLPVVVGMGMVFTGSDVDAATQFLRWVFLWDLFKLALLAAVVAIALMLISRVTVLTLSHRGPLHSLLFAAGMTVLAVITSVSFSQGWWWGICFGWGWTAHILADGLTRMGVPLWWPLSSRRVHVLPYAAFEWVGRVWFTIAMLALLGVLLYQGLRPEP